MTVNQRFGDLLTEGIVSIAKRQRKTVVGVELEIAQALGFVSQHIVERWRRGYVPKEPEQVAFLVRSCVSRGRVDYSWASSVLTQARYYASAALLQELFRASSSRSEGVPIYENLPPRYGDFLGRSAEIKRVLHGLASRWPIISIEGFAGIGKTSLAVEVARHCLPGSDAQLEQPFEAVVWISARAHPDQKLWLNDVLDTTAQVMEYPNLLQLPSGQKPAEVRKLLHTHHTLIVIDNFETIVDQDLVEWMQEVPEPSKVLITSRYTQLRSVWAVHLQGLGRAEALELIRRHAQRLDLPAIETADEATLLPMIEVTEGNPKAIEMALGHVKYGGMSLGRVVDHLHTAHQTVNDVFDYLFSHAWNMLSKEAQHILLIVPFFGETASKEAVGSAAGLQGYTFDKALSQLIEMSMLDARDELEQVSQRYSAHSLTRAFAIDRLREVPEWEYRARQQWVAWYLDFLCRQYRNVEDWPTFAVLDKERENIFAVIEWALAHHHPDSVSIVQQAWFFLHARGYWQQCKQYTLQALEHASAEGKTSERLWLSSHLGWLLTQQEGPTQEVLQWLHKVEDEITTLQHPALLEETAVLDFLGQGYLKNGDLDMAEKYEAHFLDLALQAGDRCHALEARYYLALIQFYRGQVEEAQQMYRGLLTEAQAVAWEQGEAYSAYRLAEVLAASDQFEEAEHWFKHAITMAEQWNELILQAHVHLGRASLLRKQKRLIEAYSLALTALDLYRRLGARDYQEDATDLVMGLEKELA